MKKSTKAFAAICASVVAMAGVSAGALATSDKVLVRSVGVEVQTSELTDAAGVEAVRNRIADAARSVCSINNYRSLNELRERRACMQDAIADAEEQLEIQIAQANGGTIRLALASN